MGHRPLVESPWVDLIEGVLVDVITAGAVVAGESLGGFDGGNNLE